MNALRQFFRQTLNNQNPNSIDWLQTHPESKFRRPWYFAQFGVLVLPFSPSLGVVALFAAVVLTTWQLRKESQPRHPLPWIFGAIALVMVLGIVGAVDKGEAALGLANFLPYFFVFWVLSRLMVSVAQLRRLAWLVILGSGPVMAIGIAQLLGWWAGPVLLPGVINWQLAAGGNPVGRLSSVFEYANVTASYAVIVWTIALGLAVDLWQTRKSPAPNLKFKRKWAIATLGITLLLTGLGLVLTDSRNAWALGMGMTIVWSVVLGWYWLWGSVMGAIAVILGAAFAPDPAAAPLRIVVPRFIWARLNDSLYPDRPIETLRSTQWQFCWDLSWQRPFLGWGLRNFSPLYEGAMQVWMGHPHNLLLMLAAETGWPATLAFFGAIGWMVARSLITIWRLPSGDRTVALTIWLGLMSLALFHIFDITLFDVRIGLLGWVLLASLWGLVWRRPDPETPSPAAVPTTMGESC